MAGVMVLFSLTAIPRFARASARALSRLGCRLCFISSGQAAIWAPGYSGQTNYQARQLGRPQPQPEASAEAAHVRRPSGGRGEATNSRERKQDKKL